MPVPWHVDGPLRAAAIDVGSNALRLLIVASDGDDWEVLHRERVAVRLGHHAFTKGALDSAACDAAMAALTSFRDTIRRHGVHRYRAVATAAVREAENGPDFLRRVQKRIGIRLESIDGAEEARLVHLAVRERLDLRSGVHLLCDLGGGSLEVALVDHERIHWSESRRIGTVRLLEAARDTDDSGLVQRIHDAVDRFRLLHTIEPHIEGVLLTGGNANALGKLDGQQPRQGAPGILAVDRLRNIIRDLEATDNAGRMEQFGFAADRADVILPAALVFGRIAELVGADQVQLPGWGLREGVILDLLDSARFADAADALERTVEASTIAFGRSVGFDENHHFQTARLSLSLYDQLADWHGEGAAGRRILHAAALLHDAGKVVRDRGHHKHSAYLIRNANIDGLSDKERLAAANVARYHRKAHPSAHHAEYAGFGPRWRQRISRLAAILRIADGLDRGKLQAVTRVVVKPRPDDDIDVIVHGRGALVAEAYAARRKSDLFEVVFGRRVHIEVQHDVE